MSDANNTDDMKLDFDSVISDDDPPETLRVDQSVIDDIRSRLPEYVEKITKKSKGKDMYCCPFCGSGTHGAGSDGAFHVTDGRTWYCHSCKKGGDVFDLVAQMNGIPFTDHTKDFPDVLDEALRIFGYDPEKEKKPIPTDSAVKATQRPDIERKDSDVKVPAENKKDDSPSPEAVDPAKYREYLTECMDHVDETSYFHDIGFTDDTIVKNFLGYDPERKLAIYPYSATGEEWSYYFGRSVSGRMFTKPRTDEAGPEPVFHAENLYEKAPVFITESPKDAVAISQYGGNSVAIGGTGYDKLLTQLDKKKPTQPLILCLDHDKPNKEGRTPGQEAQAKLAEALNDIDGVVYLEMIWSFDKYSDDKPKEDPADLLLSNPSQFKRDIERAIRRADKPKNTRDYIFENMKDDIDVLQRDKDRKTGFQNLDAKLGHLNSGLYIIAGTSSVGKTTMLSELCDNMAALGSHILFFSLEQSALELVSKSLSRITFTEEDLPTLSSSQIRTGTHTDTMNKAAKIYIDRVGDRVSIYEGNLSTTVKDMEQKVRCYIQRNGVRPCVLVDYLQIIPATKDKDTGRKATDPRQIVEQNVTALKRMSRSLSVPVIALSSVNRGSYLTPISFESLKESGLLEFSADCVLGLQVSAVNSPIMAEGNKKSVTAKRKFMAKARKEPERKIEVVCLKNRYGAAEWSVYFKYYQRHDFFEEHEKAFTDADVGSSLYYEEYSSEEFKDLLDDDEEEDPIANVDSGDTGENSDINESTDQFTIQT